jgi:hypothetical protein
MRTARNVSTSRGFEPRSAHSRRLDSQKDGRCPVEELAAGVGAHAKSYSSVPVTRCAPVTFSNASRAEQRCLELLGSQGWHQPTARG